MRMLVTLLLIVGAAGCQKTPEAGGRVQPEVDAGAAGAAAADPRAKEEACVDGWLTQHKLDTYGSPEGTMYAGGSPLFDERTGESKDRLEFVYAKHPDLKALCRSAAP